MNKFEHWMLKRFLKNEVKPGNHFTKVENLYTMIREAVENEYTEDNTLTINQALRDCFEESLK